MLVGMRFVYLVGLLGCFALALAGAAPAQPRVEEKVNLTVTGEITALDAAARKLTVKSTDDEGLVYEVDDAATVLSGSERIELGDLEVGWSVAMNGHQRGNRRTVTLVKVVKAP